MKQRIALRASGKGRSRRFWSRFALQRKHHIALYPADRISIALCRVERRQPAQATLPSERRPCSDSGPSSTEAELPLSWVGSPVVDTLGSPMRLRRRCVSIHIARQRRSALEPVVDGSDFGISSAALRNEPVLQRFMFIRRCIAKLRPLVGHLPTTGFGRQLFGVAFVSHVPSMSG